MEHNSNQSNSNEPKCEHKGNKLISSTPKLPMPNPVTLRFLSIHEVARLHDVSVKAIYAAIKRGELQLIHGIPAHQVDNYKPNRISQQGGKARQQRRTK